MSKRDAPSYANDTFEEKRRRRRGPRKSILGWILLSVSCTVMNAFVGHRYANFWRRQQRYEYEESHRPPNNNNVVGTRREKKSRGTRLESEKIDIHQKGVIPSHNGEYMTNILRGVHPFPSNVQRLEYKPGELQMSSTEALQHCHVNTTMYQNHIKGGETILVSHSRRHKLIYRNIPKSSSSSARAAMQEFFNGEDTRMQYEAMYQKVQYKNYTLLSFVREPLNRFYSSYDEAFHRMGPWMGSGPFAKKRPMVAKNYHKTKHRVLEKYSYLYGGMETLKDYRRFYCPPGMKAAECNDAQTIDNGTLTERFERFVQEYDGYDPFDIHLNLQVPSLLDGRTGLPLPMTILYNASEADKDWHDVARAKGVQIPEDGLTHGNKASRRFNLALVSDATKQKICRLMALDYCCLNIELPDVCKMDNKVHCSMNKKQIGTASRQKPEDAERLVIEPWIKND